MWGATYGPLFLDPRPPVPCSCGGKKYEPLFGIWYVTFYNKKSRIRGPHSGPDIGQDWSWFDHIRDFEI